MSDLAGWTGFFRRTRFVLAGRRGLCHGRLCMKFHVAREGAVMGEFEEQIFRNKVFSGEIRPSDFYWTAGFTDWRPVSEFRVARKTEPILLETESAMPPAIRKTRQRSAPAIALICICALVLLIGVAMMAGKSKPGRVPQHARVEAKVAIARGQLRAGMTADQSIRLLGQPARIERISGSKDEQWTYKGHDGPVILHFEGGVLRSF
jgi:GYF domain 2